MWPKSRRKPKQYHVRVLANECVLWEADVVSGEDDPRFQLILSLVSQKRQKRRSLNSLRRPRGGRLGGGNK
jgi:hypothetical protein